MSEPLYWYALFTGLTAGYMALIKLGLYEKPFHEGLPYVWVPAAAIITIFNYGQHGVVRIDRVLFWMALIILVAVHLYLVGELEGWDDE